MKTMLDPIAAPALCREAAYLFGEADPVGASRTLARALRQQTRGGRTAACRVLLTDLAAADPDIIPELNRIVGGLRA